MLLYLVETVYSCFCDNWTYHSRDSSVCHLVTMAKQKDIRISSCCKWLFCVYQFIDAGFKANSFFIGYATEALGNIRTVKAFTTEKYEQYKYDEANDSALSKGIQDAFGGAGMYAINSYLELGASVLILWYGGMMAMDDKQRMTPGRLITYQLYWNMLNTSYKSLLDIVTQFTRAAGAAQRVFSLMDSMPDIDISAGRSVPPGLLQVRVLLTSSLIYNKDSITFFHVKGRN